MTEPASASGLDDSSAVPKDSSPTYELEMLISGAVLYSLFQVPPLIDHLISRWEPHATYEAGFGLLMFYAYTKGALYTLIAAFVVHLGVRAYWVGLIGLNSVFGGGVRWENTQLGPVAQDVYRSRMPTLPATIARLDNFASIIFSFAFLVVLVTLVSVPIMAVVAAGGYLVSRVAFGGQHFRAAAIVILLLFAVPPMIAALIDKAYGARLPDGRARRALRRFVSSFYHLQMIGVLGPILFTISSNGRRRTTYAMFYVVMLGSLYIVMGEWVMRKGVFNINGSDYFSTRSNENAVDYGFYESQWKSDEGSSVAPSIQSDIIRDPYVRLFIPYQPERHNPGVAAVCPGVPALEPRGIVLSRPGRAGSVEDSSASRVLTCLTTMHSVRVNGASVTTLRFRFATHPRSGVEGIVTYLPADSMRAGENTITVMPPPRRPGSSNRRPLEPWVIPFWR